MKQIVARNLRRIRHERKLSQEELSFRAKVDRSYISQLETGSDSASVTMLESSLKRWASTSVNC